MVYKEALDYIGDGHGECHDISVYGKWIDKKRQYYLVDLEPSFRRADLIKSKYDYGIKRATLSMQIKNGNFVYGFPENDEIIRPGVQEYKIVKTTESNGGICYSSAKVGFRLSKSDEIITKTRIKIYDTSCYISGNTTNKTWTFEMEPNQVKPYLYGVKKVYLVVKVKKAKQFLNCRIQFKTSDIVVLKGDNIIKGPEGFMAKLLSPIRKELSKGITFKLKEGLGWVTKIIPSDRNEIDNYIRVIKNPVPKQYPSLFPFSLKEKEKIERSKLIKQVEFKIDEAIKAGYLNLCHINVL
jgi:hypothetical protein